MKEELKEEMVGFQTELKHLQKLKLRTCFDDPSGRSGVVEVKMYKGPFNDWDVEWVG